jgi:S-formylglutathione hydrolase FrmB
MGRRSLDAAHRLRPPVVTAGLMAVVLAVAFHHGVFGHELSLDVAVRYGLSGRGLQNGDWRALATSQLLTRDGFMATSIAVSLLVMLGAYEAVVGHLRAAMVAIVGAVSGPLLTAAAAGVGSALGNHWAAAALSTLDYGASAITAAAGGALVAVLGHRKLRILAVVWVIGGLVLHHQLADWEHLFSFTVGYGLGLVLGRPRSARVEVTRSSARRFAAVTGAAAYLAAGVVLAPMLVPATATTTLSAAQAIAFGVPAGTPVSAAHIERITYDSPALGTTRLAYVLLPAGYDETSRAYPVVEMLHGSPGGPLEMLNRLPVADSQLSGAVQPFIAVAPDGNGNGATETDFADAGARKMGTAVSTDLRAAIDSRFRTSGQWGVMGLSAGGFGATYLAATHPDTYRAACSLSGFFRAADPAFKGVTVSARDQASPTLHARADGRPVLVVAGGNDKDGRAAALDYDASLRSAGQPHRLVLVDGAGHDWGLWTQQLAPCLTWVLPPPPSAAQ